MNQRLAILLALLSGLGCARSESIVNSRHNLSASGPGSVKAAGETQVCIFCHTPHNSASDAPLWNRFESGAAYTPYDSPTLKAEVGQPTGSSRLCLSCHDGTLALGMVRNRQTPIAFTGGSTMPSGPGNLGTDLSNDHPVSFRYDATLAAANGELKPPSSLPASIRLDANGQLQCTACHDPHDDSFGKFLVVDNTASALCVSCHDKTGWTDSIHRTSTRAWNGSGIDPWPTTSGATVAANACENCHQPHAAGTPRALQKFATEEANCFSCHNGNVAVKNVQGDFLKASVHPVSSTTGVHSPTEDLINGTRHVECADCHDPHAARHATANAPTAPGSLAGLPGVNGAGTAVDPLQNEYELCYRCHADSTNRGAARVRRVSVQTNTRVEFDPGNPSFHPIEAPGRNTAVPSLINPWTTSSTMYCTDCHNSDTSVQAGGTGAEGPHGSAWTPILERRLVTTDNTTESAAVYALCYKCHNRTNILDDRGFKEHQKHIKEVKAACTTCHDPHGSTSNTHLINFNPDYVSPLRGVIEFVDQGVQAGNCTLICHGKEHDRLNYPR